LIDVVEDVVGVLLLASSENNDLVKLGKLLEAVHKVGSQSNRDLLAAEGEREGSLELVRNVAFEFGGNESFVHVENQQLLPVLLAELEGLEHDVFLIFIGVFLCFEFFAVLEQVDQFQVDELGGVTDFGVHHGLATKLVSLVEGVITVFVTAFLEIGVNTGLLALLFGLFLDDVLDDFELVAKNAANLPHRLGFTDDYTQKHDKKHILFNLHSMERLAFLPVF